MQSVRARIVIYVLLLLCALQTAAIWKQAQWLHQQRDLIRLLWNARRPLYHNPSPHPAYKI